jgi:hypothetical protein
MVDGVALVIKRVCSDHTDGMDRSIGTVVLRHEIKGPVARDVPSYLWLTSAMGGLMSDPIKEPPPALTAKAEQALETWLAWSHET